MNKLKAIFLSSLIISKTSLFGMDGLIGTEEDLRNYVLIQIGGPDEPLLDIFNEQIRDGNVIHNGQIDF